MVVDRKDRKDEKDNKYSAAEGTSAARVGGPRAADHPANRIFLDAVAAAAADPPAPPPVVPPHGAVPSPPPQPSDECAVCMSALGTNPSAIYGTNCANNFRHWYHTKCMMQWMKLQRSQARGIAREQQVRWVEPRTFSCPQCRHPQPLINPMSISLGEANKYNAVVGYHTALKRQMDVAQRRVIPSDFGETKVGFGPLKKKKTSWIETQRSSLIDKYNAERERLNTINNAQRKRVEEIANLNYAMRAIEYLTAQAEEAKREEAAGEADA